MVNWNLKCLLGSGSQGEVWMNEDQTHAIKQCVFDFDRLPTVLRELYAFSVFRNVPHLLQMREWRVNESKSHVQLAVDLYTHDLRTIIETNRCLESQIKYFMIQILKGLVNIHARGFIHRDIKPDNILVRNEDIVIGDFGLMRAHRNNFDQMSEGMQTIWYRAPEMFEKKPYSSKIDMWSLGVMLSEMIQGYQAFSGTTPEEQMQLHKRFLKDRRPSQSLYAWIVEGRSDIQFCTTLVEFLQGLLEFDPQKRFSAEQALSHPWLQASFFVYSFPVISFPPLSKEHQTWLQNIDPAFYLITKQFFQLCLPHFQGNPKVLLQESSDLAELIEELAGDAGPFILCSQTAKILFGMAHPKDVASDSTSLSHTL